MITVDLITITEEIQNILTQYDQSDNKDELDRRLVELRKKLGHGPEDREVKKEFGKEEFDYYQEIAKENGIPYQIFWKRIHKYGWPYDEAATKPVRKKRRNYDGLK